jgi:DNA-binding response OmpR family regulator
MSAHIVPSPGGTRLAGIPVMGRSILILEDEAVLRKHLARVFTRAGFSVATADTCAAARALLAHRRFDTVLVDVQLPDGNGMELLSGLGEHAWPRRAVVMTASVFPASEAQAQRLNVGLLRKPLDLLHVVDIVYGGGASRT